MKLLLEHGLKDPTQSKRNETTILLVGTLVFLSVALLILYVGWSPHHIESKKIILILVLFYSSIAVLFLIILLFPIEYHYSASIIYGLNDNEGDYWITQGNLEQEIERRISPLGLIVDVVKPKPFKSLIQLKCGLIIFIERSGSSMFASPKYPFVVTIKLNGITKSNYDIANQVWPLIITI